MSKKYISGEEKNPPRSKNTANQIHQRVEQIAQEKNIPFYENFQHHLNTSSQSIAQLIPKYNTKFPIEKHDLLVKEYAALKLENQFLKEYCEHLDSELQLRRAASTLTQNNAKKNGENRTKSSNRTDSLNKRVAYLKQKIGAWQKVNKRKMAYSEFEDWHDELCKHFTVGVATLKYETPCGKNT
jgi:hypothetical protein